MKAWRNIKGNNGKRPTQRTKIQGSTWLLDGLLIRAGIINPLPDTDWSNWRTPSNRGWWTNFVTLTKRLFS